MKERSWKGGKGRVTYDLDGPVPGARAECVFCDEIPVHGEYFPLVLLPRLDGEFVKTDIEQLDGAITRRYHDLILVRLGP